MEVVTSPASAPAHRTGSTVLTLLGPDGSPLADREVTVEQRSHAFGFGNIGFDFVEHGTADAEPWLRLFNQATLPFYWGTYEPERGRTRAARLHETAAWLVGQGVRVKGHPLVWHTVQPDWLMEAGGDDEVERLLRAHVREVVADFADVIQLWDAINETVIMPVFANGANAITPLAAARGRQHLIRLAFEEARAANPDATLVINDFDLSPDYERVIEEAVAGGVRIDAIGLQTHMHQGYRGEEEILAIVDRFARFGLPLQLTETTFVSGHLMPPEIEDLNDYRIDSWPTTPEGEARQADDIERHYRSLFGHPAVESVTYWGFSDAGAWLGAPSGLVRADGSPKPAYEVLDRLVRDEWWTAPTRVRTDDAGRLRVEGVAGAYRATATGTTTASFEIARGEDSAQMVTLDA
ncbi:endo-1,4-beta-xylanase [Microbacterium sp. X-17]|uniref:endo-1,4-beta-xylanase n=1 Tax=Microbacterium sp. X-17 TaxID=3144404 RepID=UPI0031F47C7A